MLDAFDDPLIAEIILQWGAQQGKTFAAQLMLAKTLATDPYPCAFADADEDSIVRVFSRLWPLLDEVKELQGDLPPKHLRRQNFIQTRTAVVHGAWARSPSKAADYGAKVIVLNEADKMVLLSTRAEADFRRAIRDRAFGYTGSKIITISTPSVKGLSYVESQRLLGDNRTWMVPCPRCGHFQRWITGNGKDPGGIRFSRLKDGRLSAECAKETAWYQCIRCQGRIEETDRWGMSQRGIWVPEGCFVSDDGKIAGEQARKGSIASFGPPHALCSLMKGVSIGTLASDFVTALLNPLRSDAMRHWINSREGNSFDDSPPALEPTTVEKRLSSDDRPGICPVWTRFLSVGVDVSEYGPTDYQFHWWVTAFGEGGRGGLVELGTSLGKKEFEKQLEKMLYPVAERPGRYKPSIVYVDSGDGEMTAAIYQFCDELVASGKFDFPIRPIKGSSDKKEGEEGFSKNDSTIALSKGAFRGHLKPYLRKIRERRHDWDLVLVNTDLSQGLLENWLRGKIDRDHRMAYTIPSFFFNVNQSLNLVRHLTGDYRTEKGWKKRYNDQHYRDGWRYSIVAGWQFTKDGREWDTLSDTVILEDSSGRTTAPLQRGIGGRDGQAFVGSQRG